MRKAVRQLPVGRTFCFSAASPGYSFLYTFVLRPSQLCVCKDWLPWTADDRNVTLLVEGLLEPVFSAERCHHSHCRVTANHKSEKCRSCRARSPLPSPQPAARCWVRLSRLPAQEPPTSGQAGAVWCLGSHVWSGSSLGLVSGFRVTVPCSGVPVHVLLGMHSTQVAPLDSRRRSAGA